MGSDLEGESGGLGVDDLVPLVTAVGHVPRVARTLKGVTGIGHRHLARIHNCRAVHCNSLSRARGGNIYIAEKV